MPCEVMLANMRFAYGRALELQAMLAKTVENEVDLALLGEVVRFRGIAQDWAKDVANYYHPKLASVTHKGDAENPLLGPTNDTHQLTAMIECLVANPEVAKHPKIAKTVPMSIAHRLEDEEISDVLLCDLLVAMGERST